MIYIPGLGVEDLGKSMRDCHHSPTVSCAVMARKTLCMAHRMAEGRRQSKTLSKRQTAADESARKFGEQCPKCGSDDVKSVEPFNPVHADGIYCRQCGRHSFPDESQ
jgi:hypothetical protein